MINEVLVAVHWLTTGSALVLLIDHSIKLSSEASTKNIIHFSQMAESTVIPRRISRAVSFYITWEPDYLP